MTPSEAARSAGPSSTPSMPVLTISWMLSTPFFSSIRAMTSISSLVPCANSANLGMDKPNCAERVERQTPRTPCGGYLAAATARAAVSALSTSGIMIPCAPVSSTCTMTFSSTEGTRTIGVIPVSSAATIIELDDLHILGRVLEIDDDEIHAGDADHLDHPGRREIAEGPERGLALAHQPFGLVLSYRALSHGFSPFVELRQTAG